MAQIHRVQTPSNSLVSDGIFVISAQTPLDSLCFQHSRRAEGAEGFPGTTPWILEDYQPECVRQSSTSYLALFVYFPPQIRRIRKVEQKNPPSLSAPGSRNPPKYENPHFEKFVPETRPKFSKHSLFWILGILFLNTTRISQKTNFLHFGHFVCMERD